MKFRRHKGRLKPANLDITPLIDVVFQLLIFFMLSSTFVVQSAVPVALPQKASVPEPVPMEIRDVIVSVQADGGGEDGLGTIYLEETPVEKGQLVATLKELKQRPEYQGPGREPLVLIRADGRVATQRIIDVMEACEEAEFRNFGIGVAAQPK